MSGWEVYDLAAVHVDFAPDSAYSGPCGLPDEPPCTPTEDTSEVATQTDLNAERSSSAEHCCGIGEGCTSASCTGASHRDLEALTVAMAEVDNLRRWKAEALPVIAGLQELGRELGLRPGVQITGAEGVAAAKALRAERDDLWTRLTELQAQIKHAMHWAEDRHLYETLRAALSDSREKWTS